MPLQTSGAISLNQIHVEAGGSSGTQCSLNDSDIRALINKASGATSSFSQFYGASSSLFSATMTVGSNIIAPTQYGGGSTSYGFNDQTRSGLFTTSWGSLSNTSASGFSNSGSTLAHLSHLNTSNAVRLVVDDNTTVPNSGWTTLTIGSTTLSRTAASFTASSNTGQVINNSQGQKGTWQWTANNPFGTSGTKSITIT